MTPLFFGTKEKLLFGIYSPPGNQPARNRGVVLCNPFGDEAIKAHRAYVHLANQLTNERFHVLRFDYYGTGDSAGESEEGRVEQWLTDIGTAADELRGSSGVLKVSFVGLRFGAALALQAAASRKDLDRVVLWDPVVRGQPFLDHLRACHADYLRDEFGNPNLAHNRICPPTGEELMGYPLPDEVRDAIEKTNLHNLKSEAIKRVALVASNQTTDNTALMDSLENRGIKTQQTYVSTGINWNSDDAMNTSLVPTEAINAIIESLKSEKARR